MAKHSSDDDFRPRGSSSSAGASRKKRKGGRGAVSCLQCRHSKVSCDLQAPCGTCIARGEEATCTLTNRLYYEDLDNAPAPKLKSMVDRLESMLLRINSSAASASASASVPSASSSSTSPSITSSPRTSRFEANTTHESEVISRLILGGKVDNSHISPGVDLQAMVAEVQYSDSTRPAPPLFHLASPSSILTRPSPDAFQSLFQIMPTRAQSLLLLASFFTSIDPLFHILHRPTFESQCQQFWDTGVAKDPFWLATYLTVAGLGLLSLKDDQAVEAQIPNGDGKDLLARSWLDGAIQSLASGEFSRRPSMESIRAIVLLNHFWVSWKSGTYLNDAVHVNASVIASAFELELHRDPDELNGFTALEAEERRRIFWAFFSIDSISRALLGKTYTPFDPSTISVRLPSHLPDEAFSLSGDYKFSFATSPSANSNLPMNRVIQLHSIALAMCRTTKLLASVRKPTSAEVNAIQEELQNLDTSVLLSEPLEGFNKILLSFAVMRLNRSCLGSGIVDSATEENVWHRTLTLRHCDSLLKMLDQIPSLGLVEKVFSATASVSAAVTIAIDLLDTPYSAPAEDARAQLAAVQSTFESTPYTSDLSPIHQRGAIILRHLTTRVEELQASGLAIGNSFVGMRHARHPSESSDGSTGFDTPSSGFLVPSQMSATRRSSDQASLDAYLSPLPPSDQSLASFNESFSDSFYPLSGDYQHETHQRSLEIKQPCPLLAPWLASTQFGDDLDGWKMSDPLTYPMVTPIFT